MKSQCDEKTSGVMSQKLTEVSVARKKEGQIHEGAKEHDDQKYLLDFC